MLEMMMENLRQKTTFQGCVFGWERWNAGEIA